MSSPRRPGWRIAAVAAAAGAPALAVAAGSVGWLGAGALLRPAHPRPPRMVLRCLAVDRLAGPTSPASPAAHQRLRLVLRGAAAHARGTYGLLWDGGHGVVGGPTSVGRRTTARTLLAWWGDPPPAAHTDQGEVRLSGDVWPDEAVPRLTPAVEVAVPGPLGPLPSWLLPPSSLAVRSWTPDPTSWWPTPPPSPSAGETWLVAVHGRGSPRSQALRVARTLAALGCTSLLMSYRNDPGAPGDGTCRFGQDEWADVEAGVAYARERGARRILLAGWSMGGAIVATFLRRSPLADAVDGVLLDSPVLDWAATLQRLLRSRRFPPGLRPAVAATLHAGLRIRGKLDRAALDHASLPWRLSVPLLLAHGTADDLVPVETSDVLSAARPDLVRYVRVDGAGHVHGWNHDPVRYDAAVAAWATDLMADLGGDSHHGVRQPAPI